MFQIAITRPTAVQISGSKILATIVLCSLSAASCSVGQLTTHMIDNASAVHELARLTLASYLCAGSCAAYLAQKNQNRAALFISSAVFALMSPFLLGFLSGAR